MPRHPSLLHAPRPISLSKHYRVFLPSFFPALPRPVLLHLSPCHTASNSCFSLPLARRVTIFLSLPLAITFVFSPFPVAPTVPSMSPRFQPRPRSLALQNAPSLYPHVLDLPCVFQRCPVSLTFLSVPRSHNLQRDGRGSVLNHFPPSPDCW